MVFWASTRSGWPLGFLVMYWSRSQIHVLFNYTLQDQILEQVQSAKYLGITTTDNLDCGQHISEVTAKATRTLGFLRRNLAFASRQTKETAYKILVWPQLEYASPIWHPYLKAQTQQTEKVQRTAARWTCRRWRNTSRLSSMLSELEWPSQETCREQSSLTFFYKIHSGRSSEILKSKSVCSTDDVINVIRTCFWQSQIVTKTNDSSFSSKSVSEIDWKRPKHVCQSLTLNF